MAKFIPNDPAREAACAKVSRDAAAQGIVLLKNENQALPLAEGQKVAVFGIGQVHTIKGGTGSGEVNNKYNINILDGLKASKAVVNEELAAAYEAYAAANPNQAKAQMLTLTTYCNPEMPVEPKDYAADGTAIYVISRIAGEGQDMKYEKGQFQPTDEELVLLGKIRENFEKVIVVLNTPGVIEAKALDALADAVVFTCLPGQEGGYALADVLTGVVNPSGKTTDTWAYSYADYISAKNFGVDRRNGNMNMVPWPTPHDVEQAEVWYEDGIYVGYRYFDTFGKDVLYPFGYGLTYADLAITGTALTVNRDTLSVTVGVLNQDENYTGREVVQVYVSAPDGKLEKPYQELKGYQKTAELKPGEEVSVTINIPVKFLASFDEASGQYILEPGIYYVRVGNSSRNTQIIGAISIEEEIVTEVVKHLTTQKPEGFELLSKKGATPIAQPGEEVQKMEAAADAIPVEAADIEKVVYTYADPEQVEELTTDRTGLTIQDVGAGNCTLEEFVAQLSNDELIHFTCGVGMDFSGFDFDAPETDGDDDGPGGMIGSVSLSVAGAAGESYDYSEKYGLKPLVLCDGPAGVRINRVVTNEDGETYEQNLTAYPVGTLLSSSWDPEVIESVGRAAGSEMVAYDVDLWLAPGMNIHRNPLCGRNFEYYAEDPLLSGQAAAAMSRGVQSNQVGVTIKHYLANNQEDMRTNSNSVIDERTLREIYLKNFEIAVREGDPWSIMTSYNDINGMPAADNYETVTQTAREEWNFNGFVMTDWGGGQSNPGISMFAGNDMIQPGGEMSRNLMAEALASGEKLTTGTRREICLVTRAMLQRSAMHILKVYLRCPAFTGKLYA